MKKTHKTLVAFDIELLERQMADATKQETKNRLFKNMYGSEFDGKSDLFGLRCGQMRGQDLVHNGGWYNKSGEKLDCGDLSAQDMTRISQELLPGELFVILGESDSFWNWVTHNPGPVGSCASTKPDISAPGIDFVAERCRFVIVPGKIYLNSDARTGQVGMRGGLFVDCLDPESIKKLFGDSQ